MKIEKRSAARHRYAINEMTHLGHLVYVKICASAHSNTRTFTDARTPVLAAIKHDEISRHINREGRLRMLAKIDVWHSPREESIAQFLSVE